MDGDRKQELEDKASLEGLSHDEAHELGRLTAEAEGKPYSSHDDRVSDDQEPKAWDEAAKRGEETQQDETATPAPSDDHLPEEERAVGGGRQPMPPTGSGFLPPKGSDEPGV